MLAKASNFFKQYRSYIFVALIVLLAIKVIVPQIDDLKDSLSALKTADLTWIAAAIVVYFSGVIIFTLQMMSLALKPIAFFMTYKVEMAGQFVSKLLPSFVGIISLNMYYLIKKGHTTNQAATVMTANALSSGIAYAILIILALSQSEVSTSSRNGSFDIPNNLILFVIILVASLVYLFFRSGGVRSQVKEQWQQLKSNTKAYKQKRLNLTLSVLYNGIGSAANVFVIFASAHSIGISLTFADALIVYTFGNIATTLVPTPGGIGAAEAGLYSGLVFIGLSGADAITVTLLYRLISYWLPIIPGYLFFWGLRKNLLAQFSFKKRYAT